MAYREVFGVVWKFDSSSNPGVKKLPIDGSGREVLVIITTY